MMTISNWVTVVCEKYGHWAGSVRQECFEMLEDNSAFDAEDIAQEVADYFGFKGDDFDDMVDWVLKELDEVQNAEPDYDAINDRRVIDGC